MKRQRTTGKGSFLALSDGDDDDDEDEADDIWSSPPASLAAAALESAFVKAIVLDVERFSFNDVGI